MVGSIDIKSRPIRLGLIVDPKGRTTVTRALQINSSLWGGVYNPIIPVYKRIPKNWGHLKRNIDTKKVMLGYLDAYDTDLIVNCTDTDISYLKESKREIINHTEIISNSTSTLKEFVPNYGLGITEILNELFQEYFRYETKYRPDIVIPTIPKQYDLFYMSVFGIIPENLRAYIDQNYKDVLQIKYPKVNIKSYAKLLDKNNLFPRRISHYGINTYLRSHMDHSYLFFMDTKKIQDIIDYWNLRALGRQVLAVPNTIRDTEEFKKIVVDFIKSQNQKSKYNDEIFFHSTALSSRNTKFEEVQKYLDSLTLPKDNRGGNIYTLQSWYPDIWDDWSRKHNSYDSDSIYAEQISIDVQDEKSVRFKPLIPDFCNDRSLFHKPRLINDIKFRIYGRDVLYAQALPENYGSAVVRSISSFSSLRGEWRISRDGVSKMINSPLHEVWELPNAKNVFVAWLKDQEWESKISTPGLLAQQIYEKLNGNLHALANIELLNVLEDMNKKHIEKSVGDFKTRFPNLEMYLDYNMLTIGYRFSCNVCHRYSWYKLSELNDKMKCPKCLTEIKIVGNIESGGWYYKPIGPFSIDDYANGAYSVLLALNLFLKSNMRLDTTPVFSIEMENKLGNKLEADFGVLWSENGFHGKVGGVLFGECKTFGDFDKNDFKKMDLIAKSFPGAILAFCTLKETLNKKEIKGITKLARKGRKYWKNDRPLNPVLILTRKEIFDLHGMPYCWDDIENGQYKNIHDFLDLIDTTQQIYLKLDSWKTYWYAKWDAKRKALQDKIDTKVKK